MNIIFILCDQLRYDALSCNGAPVCRTPNIDRIAQNGVRMNRCFSSNALCSPARASLLTGLYPHMHGQLANLGNFNGVFDTQMLNRPGYTHALSGAGYSVGYAGKWHLPAEGDRKRWAIDEWHTSRDYLDFLHDNGIDYDMGRDEVAPIEFGPDAPFYGRCSLSAELHQDCWTTDRTVSMLRSLSKRDAPFMVCSAFHGPHFPYAVPAPYDTLYDPKEVPRWPNFDEMFEGKPMVQQKEMMRWNVAHLTWPDWQKVIATYWGYVSYLDDLVGRILDELEALGIEDETAIVFTADHGDMMGSHRLFNKGFNMYDEDHHVPLIVRWPGTGNVGVASGGFCGLTDLYPTFLAMAGLSAPERVQGTSLEPLMKGGIPDGWRDSILCEFNGYESTLLTMRMVRTERWKYVYNPFDRDELYDMQSDPGELRNLAELPAFAHVLRRMKVRMLDWLRDTEDGIVDITSWQSNSYALFVSDREL